MLWSLLAYRRWSNLFLGKSVRFRVHLWAFSCGECEFESRSYHGGESHTSVTRASTTTTQSDSIAWPTHAYPQQQTPIQVWRVKSDEDISPYVSVSAAISCLKWKWSLNISCRFAATCTASVVELFLFNICTALKTTWPKARSAFKYRSNIIIKWRRHEKQWLDFARRNIL